MLHWAHWSIAFPNISGTKLTQTTKTYHIYTSQRSAENSLHLLASHTVIVIPNGNIESRILHEFDSTSREDLVFRPWKLARSKPSVNKTEAAQTCMQTEEKLALIKCKHCGAFWRPNWGRSIRL